jgi:hypothetical protein
MIKNCQVITTQTPTLIPLRQLCSGEATPTTRIAIRILTESLDYVLPVVRKPGAIVTKSEGKPVVEILVIFLETTATGVAAEIEAGTDSKVIVVNLTSSL